MQVSAEKLSRLQHLVDILRNCPTHQIRNILSEMDADIWIDRDALLWLQEKLFFAGDITRDLSAEDLKFICKKLKKETLSVLLEEMKVRDIDSYNLVLEILPEWKNKKINSNVSLETAYSELKTLITESVSKGKIAYNGILIYLDNLYCRKEGVLAEKNISAFVLKPFLTMQDPLQIVIYTNEKTNWNGVRISLQTTGERYFDSDKFYFQSSLGLSNQTLLTLYPEWKETGPITVWIDIEGFGEISTIVFVTLGTRRTSDVQILESQVKEKMIHCKGKFFPEVTSKNPRMLYTAYCTRCGIPVYNSFTNIEKNNFTLQIPIGEFFHEHDSNFFVHAGYNETQFSFTYNWKSSQPISEFIVQPEIEPEEPFYIPLEENEREKFTDSKIIFQYILSESPATNSHYTNQFFASPKPAHKGAVANFNRKLSPLELAVASGEISLFLDHSTYLDTGYFFPGYSPFFQEEKSKIELQVPKRFRVKDLYLTLISINGTDKKIYKNYFIPVNKKPCIVVDNPASLFEKESVEMDVFTIPEKDVSLFRIDESKKESIQKVSGTFFYRVIADKEYQFSLEGNGTSINKKITIPMKEILETRIEFIDKNHTFVEEPLTKVYPNPDTLIAEISPKFILDYIWGCSEQTAAKVATLAYLLCKTKNKDWILPKLEEGLQFLESYKNDKGLFQFFKGTEHDKKSSAAVYVNLSLLKPYKNELSPIIPKYFKILDDLELLLTGIKIEREGRMENAEFFLGVESLPKLLKWEEDSFQLIKSGYFSLQSLLYYSLAHLIEKKKDELEIFGSYKKIEHKIYSTGIKGILQKWKILSPDTSLEVQTKTKVLNSVQEKIKPYLNLQFLKDSYPSTSDMIALINLLQKVSQNQKDYKYKKNGSAKTEVLSNWTFIQKDAPLEIRLAGESSPLKIEKTQLQKGDCLVLKWNLQKIVRVCNYYLYLPALFHYSNAYPLYLNPSYSRYPIRLQSLRRGSGRILLVEEPAYETSERKIIDLGIVLVE